MIGYLFDETLEDILLDQLLITSKGADIPFCAISIDSMKHMLAGHKADVLIGADRKKMKCSLPRIVDCTFPVNVKLAAEKYGADFISDLCKKTYVCIQKSVNKCHFPAFLYQAGLFEHAIPTLEITSYNKLKKAISLFPNAILKPSAGRMGTKVYRLHMDEVSNEIIHENNAEAKIFTEKGFNTYVDELRQAMMGHALLQPCMDFRLDDGHSLVFKLLRHRDESGEWRDVGTYAMIGGASVVANISKGGSFGDVRECLRIISVKNKEELYDKVLSLGLSVAKGIEKKFGLNAYCLGIDIAIERNTLQPYVIEANTYPNSKRFTPAIAKMRLSYYKYLQKVVCDY